MNSGITSDFFVANRQRLTELFTGTAPIVISANGLLQRNSDVTYKFRQDSTFWYFTGITEPDAVLVIDRMKEYIILPSRDEQRMAFDGAVDIEALSKLSGIENIYDEEEGYRKLAARIKRVKHVATLAPNPAHIKSAGIYTNPARARVIELLKSFNNDLELLDLRPHVTMMRAVKQPIELEQIRSAIKVTADALKKLSSKGFGKFTHEFEVEAELTKHFKLRHSDHAYEPIVAGGKNAVTLHYNDNDQPIERNDLLLLDVGAEVNHYAADITRTYAVGQTSKRQQQVYDAVQEVQEYALSKLQPGVLLREYEDLVVQFMGEKLRALGLIKSIDVDAVRRYYPHATSHFLGLDVHDVGNYDKPLEPGMVLTVEPGIYIPEEGIGVRIEDDILITEDGNVNLSEHIPRVLE